MVSNKLNCFKDGVYHGWSRNSVPRKNIRVIFKRKKKNRNRNACKKHFIKNKKVHKKRNDVSIFNEFLRRSSSYTLNRIGRCTTSMGKAFWFIISIIGLAGCLSQIGQFLASYYSYGVVVNLESLKPKYLSFPAVTVCNINSFRREFEPCVKQIENYHKCFGLNHTHKNEVIHKGNVTLPKCIYDIRIFQNKNKDRFDWLYLIMSQSYKSRVKYGHQFKDLVRRCVYNGRNCDSGDFKLSVSYLYGNCYTFKSRNEEFLSSQSGPASGLKLELDLEVDKYLTFTQTVGARVEIHDSHLEHRIDKKGIFLSPGYETNIAVTKSVISRLPSPYKDHCRKYKSGDSPENCRDLCRHKLTTSLCACTTIRRFQRGVQQCNLTNPLIMCCLAMIMTKKYSCDCPLFCEEKVYRTQLSSYLWPTSSYYEENKNKYFEESKNSSPLPYSKFKDTRLRVSVYYDTLDYFVYRQRPMYESSEIFSHVGNHLALWLGVSLMFIFECLEYMTMFFSQKLRYLSYLLSNKEL